MISCTKTRLVVKKATAVQALKEPELGRTTKERELGRTLDKPQTLPLRKRAAWEAVRVESR